MSIAADFVDSAASALTVASMIGPRARGRLRAADRLPLPRGARGRRRPGGRRRSPGATAGRTTAFAGGTLLVAILVAAFLVPGDAAGLALRHRRRRSIVLAVAGPWSWPGDPGPGGPEHRPLADRPARRPHPLAGDQPRRPAPRPTWRRWSAALLLLVAFPATSLATGPVTIEQLPPRRPDAPGRGNDRSAPSGRLDRALGGCRGQRRRADHGAGRLAALSRWQAAVAARPGGRAPWSVPPPWPAGWNRCGGPGRNCSADGGRTRFARMTRPASTGPAGRWAGCGAASGGPARERRRWPPAAAGPQFGAGRLRRGLALALAGGAGANAALRNFSRGAHLLAARPAQRPPRGLGARLQRRRTGLRSGRRRAGGGAAGAAALRRRRQRHRDGAAGRDRDAGKAGSGLARTRRAHGRHRRPALPRPRRRPARSADRGQRNRPGRRRPLRARLPGPAGGAGRDRRGGRTKPRACAADSPACAKASHLQRHLAARLEAGTGKLASGSRRLAWGSDRIKAAAAQLSGGLARLEGGARRLAAGLGVLRGGNAALGQGLSAAFHRTEPLVRGAQRARDPGQRRPPPPAPRLARALQIRLLHALGTRRRPRRRSAGSPARRSTSTTAAPRRRCWSCPATGSKTRPPPPSTTACARRADALAAATGTRVELTGGVVQATEYARVTTARLPALVIAITLVTLLVMIAVLRALPLALLAIALNLLTVAAAFGVLRCCCSPRRACRSPAPAISTRSAPPASSASSSGSRSTTPSSC